MPLMGAAFALLLALAAFFFLRLSGHRPPAVTLPAPEQEAHGGEVVTGAEQEALRRVEVTPETVRLVIERLARPENYRRVVSIERFWSGASGVTTAEVAVAGGWTRVDRTDMNGDTRHSITSPTESWVWYGDGADVYHGAAALTADEEQSIPTYETILRLDPADIAVADYRSYEGLNCIYVETATDAAGYVDCFFIGVDSGLLVSMERTRNGERVYLMAALTVERDCVGAEAFTLPDETPLFDPQPGGERGEENNEESEGL